MTERAVFCRVNGCGRQIVPGAYLRWVHLENPGRDHHYAAPAPRPAADDLARGLGAAARRDDRLPTEAPTASGLDPVSPSRRGTGVRTSVPDRSPAGRRLGTSTAIAGGAVI